MTWTTEIQRQIEFYWTGQLRPRLDGLTDDEYFWEPTANAWTVRPTSDGKFAADFTVPPPEPPPVTTIAWRVAHLLTLLELQQVLFGAPPVDWQDTTPPPGTAAEALTRLDELMTAWIKGIASLDDNTLTQPTGQPGTPSEGWTVTSMLLHQNRELIHHGAEIALLRDLYRDR